MHYNKRMNFEWGDEKNFANFKKHQVWFEEARTAWADPGAIEFLDDDHSETEDRYIRIGYSTGNRILMAVFCERDLGSTIRIISARTATPKECRDYEE